MVAFGPTASELRLSGLRDELLLGVFSKTRFGMLTDDITSLLERETVKEGMHGKSPRTPVVLMGIEVS